MTSGGDDELVKEGRRERRGVIDRMASSQNRPYDADTVKHEVFYTPTTPT